MSATQPSSLGKYEIRGTLGKGAMGTVYDGWDPVIDRRVAIKTVRLPDAHDEEAIEGLARFKREAQAAGRLTHPNIVGVFDYGETGDVAYIVMEFVEGRSLKDVLAANERMTVPDIVALMEGVLAGLGYSHGRGVVHRDIKPANIMLTADGRAKVADFGIARIEASSMTQAGTVMGTPAYMSPEQFMGQVVDRRTDIYSCGVMLYQLLTGDRPFDGSMTAIMHKAMTTTPPRPSELAVTAPAELDPVVAKAMARRPEDRYDTAEAFAHALRAPAAEAEPFASDQTIMAAPAPAAARPPPAPVVLARRGSKVPAIAGGTVALAAIAAAAAWLLLPGPTAPIDAGRQASVAPAPPSPTAPVQQASVAPAPAAMPPALPPAPPAVNSPPPAATSPFVVPPPPASIGPASVPDTEPPATAPRYAASQQAPAPPAMPASPPAPPAVYSPPPQATTAAPATAPTSGSQPSLPARSAASVEAAMAASLPGIKCSLARLVTAPDGGLRLAGVVGQGQPEEELRRAAVAADPAGLGSDIQTFDGPYCPALDLLRPVADALGRNRGGMDLVQSGGPASLHDNDVIALQVTMPGFAGFLHVAYLQHDATVSPQVPGPGYPAQTYAAQARIVFGKKRPDFEGWHVGPPFGTDMIVAVASTAPLFSRALPDTQPLAAYLSSLQTAIEALRRRGGSVAAAALVLDTRPGT